METVLINLGIFLLIGFAIALPILLLARYTRSGEPLGNRFLGFFAKGLSDKKEQDKAGR